jgi:hypothetical protein
VHWRYQKRVQNFGWEAWREEMLARHTDGLKYNIQMNLKQIR